MRAVLTIFAVSAPAAMIHLTVNVNADRRLRGKGVSRGAVTRKRARDDVRHCRRPRSAVRDSGAQQDDAGSFGGALSLDGLQLVTSSLLSASEPSKFDQQPPRPVVCGPYRRAARAPVNRASERVDVAIRLLVVSPHLATARFSSLFDRPPLPNTGEFSSRAVRRERPRS